MITIATQHAAELNDAELVAESLDGNREAFRQIVERYKTLVSSVAYCATGSLSASEDLAQETFVAAWKKLPGLREPAKLRSWLCGMVRFLISKEFRRQGHEPLDGAESLETVDKWASPEPLPPDHAISEEEKAILWRSLERIPEIYREHQSIEAVAADLELSEDAVKQRLSRGRKLLQEQFLAFVAGALRQTTPGKTFTLSVLAVLPLLATTAKAATAGATASKAGAMAKATGMGAFFQAILKGVSGFLGAISPILLLGGYFGFKMGGDARQSPRKREAVTTFWRIIVGCLASFVLVPLLLLIVLGMMPVAYTAGLRQSVLGGLTVWLGLMYAVVPAALMLWGWQRRRKVQPQPTSEPEATVDTSKKKRFSLWLAIAMIGTACLLGLLLADTNWKVQRMTSVEFQKMVAEGKGNAAEVSIMQLQNGYRYFWIMLRENGHRAKFTAPVDDTTLTLLKERGIKCPTYIQGRDFEMFGWPGRFLLPLCIFILAIGGVLLLRKPGKFNPQGMDADQARKMQRVERLGNRVFGTGLALVLTVAAVLLGLITRWQVHTVSTPEVQQIVAAGNVRCEVFQYNNGTKELWLTLDKSRRYPTFSAPADEATLALLKDHGIAYRNLIQGRDFGFSGPDRWVALPCVCVLAAGAIALLWQVVKRNKAAVESCGLSVAG